MSEGKKVLFILLAFVVIIGGLYFLLSHNLDKKLTKLDSNITVEEEQRNELQNKLDFYDEKLDVQDINTYYNYLPCSKGISQLLAGLNDSASDKNIDIVSLTVEEGTENSDGTNKNKDKNEAIDTTITMNINVTISGSYINMRDFIDSIYNSERLIRLKTLQWINNEVQSDNTNNSQTKPENITMAELKLETYYAPQMKGIIKDLEKIPSYNINETRIDPTE